MLSYVGLRAGRDDKNNRAILRSGTSLVEREKGRTGSPWNEAIRTLVTALNAVCVSPGIRA